MGVRVEERQGGVRDQVIGPYFWGEAVETKWTSSEAEKFGHVLRFL